MAYLYSPHFHTYLKSQEEVVADLSKQDAKIFL